MFSKIKKTIRLYKIATLEVVAALATICKDHSRGSVRSPMWAIYLDHFECLSKLEHELKEDIYGKHSPK